MAHNAGRAAVRAGGSQAPTCASATTCILAGDNAATLAGLDSLTSMSAPAAMAPCLAPAGIFFFHRALQTISHPANTKDGSPHALTPDYNQFGMDSEAMLQEAFRWAFAACCAARCSGLQDSCPCGPESEAVLQTAFRWAFAAWAAALCYVAGP